MSKIQFNKLNLKKKDEVKTFTYNDTEIEVKQYLPLNEKLVLISNVINQTVNGEYNFKNPLLVECIAMLEIIFAYTNLTFTDKQKEDPTKLYDILEQADFINAVVEQIPQLEYNTIREGIEQSIDAYYQHVNSALGIMEAITQDYSNLNFDAEAIRNNIADPNNLSLLKDITTKLG